MTSLVVAVLAVAISLVTLTFSFANLRGSLRDFRKYRQDAEALDRAFAAALEAAESLEESAVGKDFNPAERVEPASGNAHVEKSADTHESAIPVPTYMEHFGVGLDLTLEHASKVGVISSTLQKTLAEWMAVTPAKPLTSLGMPGGQQGRIKWRDDVDLPHGLGDQWMVSLPASTSADVSATRNRTAVNGRDLVPIWNAAEMSVLSMYKARKVVASPSTRSSHGELTPR